MSGVFSLWHEDDSHAWRSSRERVQLQTAGGGVEGYYPTATSHAILAMEVCGVWSEGTKHLPTVKRLKTLELDIPGVSTYPAAEQVLRRLLSLQLPGESTDRPDAWFKQVLNSTSHGKQEEDGGAYPPRISILLGHLLPAVSALTNRIDDAMREEATPQILAGLREMVLILQRALSEGAESRCDEVWLSEHQGLSPHLLLYAVIALQEREELMTVLGVEDERRQESEPARQLLVALKGYFVRQVDRLMARSQVPMDPTYDSNSLAFALGGLDLLERGARSTPFYWACVQAVVAGQRDDGCWPDGVSVTFSPAGDTVQQPSVEVARHAPGSLS
jgi:hypothetical protein